MDLPTLGFLTPAGLCIPRVRSSVVHKCVEQSPVQLPNRRISPSIIHALGARSLETKQHNAVLSTDLHEAVEPIDQELARTHIRSSESNILKNGDAETASHNFESTFCAEFGERIPHWLTKRLKALGFVYPTNVQRKAMNTMLPDPGELLGRDTIVHAQTGSGKTLSYLIPLLVEVDPERARVQGLIVVPTPELGMQVYKIARRLASAWEAPTGEKEGKWNANLSVAPMLDRGDLRRQKLQLREAAPRVIIGNPKRIVQLVDSGRLRLDLLRVLVVDEFDACLLDDATTKSLQTIMSSRGREQRQTVLVSATVPQHKVFLKQCVDQNWTKADIEHVWIEGNSRQVVPLSLVHRYAVCESKKKLVALCNLLQKCSEKNQSGLPDAAIVFVAGLRPVHVIVDAMNSVLRGCAKLDGLNGEVVVGITDSSSVSERRSRMDRFRSGDARILVSTDLAARGLDVTRITHTFNFDLPQDADKYLHRAGRAGRLGRVGVTVSIVGQGEEFVLDRFSNELGIKFHRIQRNEKGFQDI